MIQKPITLVDDQTGTLAAILPSRGFNCYRFEAVHAGKKCELLWTHAQFVSGEAKASSSGIPLLFPFAGRIRGGQFQFEGKTYRVNSDDGRGNAIHGFVLDRPFEVMEVSKRRAVGRFVASRVEPAILKEWPADFSLTVSYELAGNTLRSEFTVENCSEYRLPCALGTHPYFRVPVVPGEDPAQCVVTVPAGEYWELVGLLPTGRKLPAQGRFALASGLDFSATQLDDVFTHLDFQNHQGTATIRDPASGATLRMTFDDTFHECVVYNPPHREAICIEPYTAVPDPFTLDQKGIPSGMRILAPGESFRARITLSLE